MNSQSREVVALAERLGFTFDGYDGSGHLVLSLPDGTRTSIPATPGEYRGRKNAIATLERLSGRKLPRANHRRSRKTFAEDTAEVEASRRRHETAFQQELERRAAVKRAADSDRRRREIEELMRP